MKPKYKNGTFVEFTLSGHLDTGITEAQVIRDSGVSYILKGKSSSEGYDEVKETDITTAYRPIVARKPKAAKKGVSSRKNTAAVNSSVVSAKQ